MNRIDGLFAPNSNIDGPVPNPHEAYVASRASIEPDSSKTTMFGFWAEKSQLIRAFFEKMSMGFNRFG